ncbi:hypothetical protein ENBRE01_0686 [Enteropsectra breve]|nr:hypothetical protein ENBRE01_0686 [Enteropsectra breve]
MNAQIAVISDTMEKICTPLVFEDKEKLHCSFYLNATPKKIGYESQSSLRKEEIFKRSRLRLTKKSWLDLFMCKAMPEIQKRVVPHGAMDLMKYIIQNGLTTPFIFRFEGERRHWTSLIKNMELHYTTGTKVPYDFSRYSILDCGSALKYFIRDIMNGLYDFKLIDKIRQLVADRKYAEAKHRMVYLIGSMEEDVKEFWIVFRRLLQALILNSRTTKMDYLSICNILSLTTSPLEAYTKVEHVLIQVDFFKIFFEIKPQDALDELNDIM